MLRAGVRRRRRHGSSLYDRRGGRACQATHRNVALSVSLHGAAKQTTRSTADGAGDCPLCSRCSAQMAAKTSTHSRRQVIRRSHDVAGPGKGSARKRARLGVLGVSICIRPDALRMTAPSTCSTSKSRCYSYKARAIRWRHSTNFNRSAKSLQACNAQIAYGRRSFFSRAGADWPERHADS